MFYLLSLSFFLANDGGDPTYMLEVQRLNYLYRSKEECCKVGLFIILHNFSIFSVVNVKYSNVAHNFNLFLYISTESFLVAHYSMYGQSPSHVLQV